MDRFSPSHVYGLNTAKFDISPYFHNVYTNGKLTDTVLAIAHHHETKFCIGCVTLKSKPYTLQAKHRSAKCLMLLAREIGLKKGMRVLEVGSGAGVEVLWFASSGVNCVALEINSKLCITIKERLKRAKLWNLNAIAIRADAQNLPFQDAIFDAAFCKAVLHHVPKPFLSIIEMHRVVRKQGVVAAIDEPNALNPLWHIARFFVLYLHFKAYFLAAFEFLREDSNERKIAMSFYRWQLQEYFKEAHFQFVKNRCIWLPYATYSRAYFKIWLLLERVLERSFIPYTFGQLYIIGKK